MEATRATATALWHHIYRGKRGLMQVFTGIRRGDQLVDTQENFFNYPAAVESAAEWAQEKSREGREVYFCTHLLTRPKRTKENAADVLALWADLDKAEMPNGYPKPSAMVRSSAGRLQAYWQLTDPLPPEIAEKLNQRLTQAIGADPSGYDLTQLLRVPDTTNHKHAERPAVKVLEITDISYTPRKLEELLPEVTESKANQEGEDSEEEPPVALDPESLRVWRGELYKEKNGRVNRSASLVWIGRVLYDAGATKPTIIRSLRERDITLGWHKYTDRRDADKRYADIFAELESNGRRPRNTSSRGPTENGKPSLPPNTPNTPNTTNTANTANRPITAAELLSVEYPPTRWVIPDILPEGVTLLVGKPKKGKSWMALDMCEAIASGGTAFGIKHVEQGDSLYLALEDNQKRLQKRLRKVLNGRPAPERMRVHVEWPKLGDGGAELLNEWLAEHPEARLVVIDTLTKVRNPARGQNIYAEDYAALETLLPIASNHGVAIVVVYHLRKAAAADPLDEISSSTGLTAGVDGFLILRRTPGSKGPTLYVDGRDIEEPMEYALHWNHNTATWTIEGTAEEVHVSKERADILLVLNRNQVPMSPKEVWEELPNAKRNNVRYLLSVMFVDGQVVKNSESKYSPANPTHA